MNAGLITPVKKVDDVTGETHVIAVRLPAGAIPAFRGQGWVAVEMVAADSAARKRFHALRPAFYGLKASAVLLRAVVTPDQAIEPQRAVMGKDAAFLRLRDLQVGIASRDQIKAWGEKADELIALDEAKAQAQRPGQFGAPRPSAKPRFVAAGLAVAAAGLVAALALMPGGGAAPEPVPGTTLLMSDPRDPSFVIEYAVAEDGSRRAIRRMTRDQLQSMTPAEATASVEGRVKTLVDGINVFLKVRQ